MNQKVIEQIKNGCAYAREQGVRLQRGPWFTFDSSGTAVGCCAIGATIYHAYDPQREDYSRPGYVETACKILKVDAWWLHRFWMGFDRNHQIIMVSGDKDEIETKDDVSAFGIQLAKSLGL